jgi:hypothetical protein
MSVCRATFQFIGSILCGFLTLSGAKGEVPKIFSTDPGTVDGLVQPAQSKSDVKTRRDPFRPIIKPRSISSLSLKSHLESPAIKLIPTVNNPNWKLLGIIHGQYGRQAVIQVSPKERILVRPGAEIVRSGWIIKSISKGEVLLEHSSPSISGKGSFGPKVFILSFATLGQSS